jgi:predicted phosphodiesterase
MLTLLASLIFTVAPAGSETPAAAPPAPDTTASTVRIFFLSDAHSRHRRVARFVEEANRAQPDLVLEGGDIVHDGTEAEFRRALAQRAQLHAPWHAVPGNHDLELRGDIHTPPLHFPELRTVHHADLRIILLDNHSEVLTEEQFRQLEAELGVEPERRTLVVMHVPVVLEQEPAALRLRHALPFQLASPTMREPGQVEHFTAMMERYGVLAVLAGHTHAPDHFVRGGVHYIATGALGGLTPGVGIANQYTDILLDGHEVTVRRVEMGEPPRDPGRFVARAFRFYAELNRFNHREQGWSYVPSASVGYRGGVKRIETRTEERTVYWGAATFERLLGERGRQSFHSDLGLAMGPDALIGDVALGYRLRALGDFNRGVYLGGAATASLGMLRDAAPAGVGAQFGVGAEWRHLGVELSRNRATNQRATAVTLGYRF